MLSVDAARTDILTRAVGARLRIMLTYAPYTLALLRLRATFVTVVSA